MCTVQMKSKQTSKQAARCDSVYLVEDKANAIAPSTLLNVLSNKVSTMW